MIIRNYTYTRYKGIDCRISQNNEGRFVIYYDGDEPPDRLFKKTGDLNVFILTTNPSVDNAYSVETKGFYKGKEFQIDKFENGMYRLSTDDRESYKELNLTFVDRGWYEKWVSYDELESIWEERSPSAYGLPMPEGLERIKYLKPPNSNT